MFFDSSAKVIGIADIPFAIKTTFENVNIEEHRWKLYYGANRAREFSAYAITQCYHA